MSLQLSESIPPITIKTWDAQAVHCWTELGFGGPKIDFEFPMDKFCDLVFAWCHYFTTGGDPLIITDLNLSDGLVDIKASIFDGSIEVTNYAPYSLEVLNRFEITNRDFIFCIQYALTNTELASNDCRVELIHSLTIVQPYFEKFQTEFQKAICKWIKTFVAAPVNWPLAFSRPGVHDSLRSDADLDSILELAANWG